MNATKEGILMKKLFATAGVLAMVGAGALLAPAHADPISTDAGSATVGEAGYTVLLDGAAANPDPLDGYVGVDDNGNVNCSDEGNGYNEDGSAAEGCNPSLP